MGRTDLLKPVEHSISHRAESVDLSGILKNPYAGEKGTSFEPRDVYNFHLERTLDQKILLKKLASALLAGKPASLSLDISSTDRAFGTLFGSEITRRHGDRLAEDTYQIRCTGGAGQSFGAFIPKGLTLELEGDSNDYFGKGLSGGQAHCLPAEEEQIQGRGKYHHRQRGPVRRNLRQGICPAAWPVSGSVSATPAPRRWSRAWATTAVST